MGWQADDEEDLNYRVAFRSADRQDREPRTASAPCSSWQRFANESRRRRGSGQLFNGAHRRGSKFALAI